MSKEISGGKVNEWLLRVLVPPPFLPLNALVQALAVLSALATLSRPQNWNLSVSMETQITLMAEGCETHKDTDI